MADPTGGIATTIVGSAITARGAKKAAQTQADAADRAAALQYEATLPKNVKSLLGEFTYDDATKQAEIALTPELEQIYRDRLARAAQTTAGIGAFDPATYQQQFYEEQRALAAPGEERERLALENRLRAQGLLGSTTGGIRTQSLLESQATKDLMRRAEARTAAQQEQTFLRGLEAGDITAATGIAGLGGELANIGQGIGSRLGAAAGAGAAMQFEAAQNLADAQAGFWSKIGGTIGDSYGTLFNTPTTRTDYVTPATGTTPLFSPAQSTTPTFSQGLNNYLRGGSTIF